MTKTYIAEIDNTATFDEFVFSAIPSFYKRLIIEGTLRSSVTGGSKWDQVHMYLNAETTPTNYHRQGMAYGNGGGFSTGETADCNIAYITADDSLANAFGSVRIVIEDYAGSNKKMMRGNFDFESTTDAVMTGQHAVTSDITAAVTTITLQADDHPTHKLKGFLTLYGET